MSGEPRKRYSLRGKMIRYNLLITLMALVLCGSVFVISVWMIIKQYINSDINFFLTTTADTMDTRLGYCEDVIYSIRDNQELMDYLERVRKYGSQDFEQNRENIDAAFEKVTGISNQSSLGAGSAPLVEEIYLFDKQGNYVSTSYYAMIYAETEESNRQFEQVYKTTLEDQDKDYGYYKMDEQNDCLAYPVYNDNMEKVGSALFKIREDALQTIMEDTGKYTNSFWSLLDNSGNPIAGENESAFLEHSGEILQIFQAQPYQQQIGNINYRIWRKQLCMDAQIVIGIPENHAMELMYDSIRIYVGIIAVITGLAFVIFVLIIYRMTRPFKEVTDKLQAVQGGDFETKLPDYNSMEFHEISVTFNEMTAYVNHLINQVYEKQISIKDMEMKFLQTQMNPHFMFNVLNTIALQAKMDENEEVYKMIRSFSQLIQAKIYRNKSEKVQIRQELEYVEYYLYLQSYRYGDRLTYEIQIGDEKLLDLFIPKLCMQLIVENAVVHGIEPKMENGHVTVYIYEKEEKVFIDTVDDGVGFDTEGEIVLPMEKTGSDGNHNHVGLNNAHHIIQLMYGEDYGVSIHSRKGVGTTVSICIPLDKKQ
ncbi:MAG: sensor histidine kinase [Lachnospiraceae bacterium]|nr:sensor histidine kinase [Lachnospiraceae bacterium]